MGRAGVKYFIKIIFDIKSRSSYLKYQMGQISINSEHYFYFGTNLGLAIGNYFIKVIFGIKVKISIFETSNMLNFNKF